MQDDSSGSDDAAISKELLLFHAASLGRLLVVRDLLSKGVDVNVQDSRGRTVFDIASTKSGNEALLDLLTTFSREGKVLNLYELLGDRAYEDDGAD